MPLNLPPNPNRFRSMQQWAQNLYEFLSTQTEASTQRQPQPVLLAHKLPTGELERASVDGLLMYEPGIGVVVSENGAWRPMTSDFGLFMAEREIQRLYGDNVSVVRTAKSLDKFGRNDDMDTGIVNTIWEGPTQDEPYILTNTNDIDRVVSTNAADTIEITIIGHSNNGSGLLTEVIQNVTLNGTTPVILATPLFRCQRLYTTNGGSPLVGEITVEDSSGNVYNIIAAGEQQSYKCAFSTADGEYLIITQTESGVTRTQDGQVDFSFESRLVGETFKPIKGRTFRRTTGVTDDTTPLFPCLIIRPNSDVRAIGVSNANNMGATAEIFGYYAQVIT